MTDSRAVLVTGASGFIGRHVLPCLVSRDYAVHAVGRTPMADLPPGVIWHSADLLSPGAARALMRAIRPSYLLHLAWTTSPGVFWSATDNADWVAASLDLYRNFAAVDGRRAVFVGTCAEYDWSHDWLDEQATPCSPETLYGVAKDALHRVLRHTAARDGVALAWGRIFSVYGPHEPEQRLVPSIVRPLLRGEPALCGEGIVERDFLHVSDMAGALAATLDSTYVGTVNIASGLCVPLRDIIRMVADQMGRPDLIRLGAHSPRVFEPLRLAAATAILRERVGFTPYYGLSDGLADTIAWWRHNA